MPYHRLIEFSTSNNAQIAFVYYYVWYMRLSIYRFTIRTHWKPQMAIVLDYFENYYARLRMLLFAVDWICGFMSITCGLSVIILLPMRVRLLVLLLLRSLRQSACLCCVSHSLNEVPTNDRIGLDSV